MKKTKTQLFIIWEGPDEVGKTSTRKLVEKKRNGKDVMIDRFIGSNLVYGKIFKRYNEIERLTLIGYDTLFKNVIDPVLIYLTAPATTIIERIKKDKHEKINTILLNKTIKEYDNYFENCNYNSKIKIDTSKHKQDEVVNIIIKFLKKC